MMRAQVYMCVCMAYVAGAVERRKNEGCALGAEFEAEDRRAAEAKSVEGKN